LCRIWQAVTIDTMGNEHGRPGRQGGESSREKDRRASARLPIEMWVEELLDAQSQVFRRAGNLSRGGMYLDQTIPIPIGTRVRLRFTLPGDAIPTLVSAEIVSISASDTLGMGVKFLDVDEAAQSRIDAYVSRALTPVP
jgi:uncharacterized protein (TIGR02266 family)